MNAKQLCTFLAVCLTASYVLGAPDYYGGGIGGGGNMADYDDGMMGDGGMMDEYDGEMGGQMVNDLDGGMMGKGDGRWSNCQCVPRRGWRDPDCPGGWTNVGVCLSPGTNACQGCPYKCCR